MSARSTASAASAASAAHSYLSISVAERDGDHQSLEAVQDDVDVLVDRRPQAVAFKGNRLRFKGLSIFLVVPSSGPRH